MDRGRAINVHLGPKAVAVAALGTGVLVGAGAAYIITRLHERTLLTQQIAHLHSTILEVKHNLASLETELERLHGIPSLSEESSRRPTSPSHPLHRKTVSFSTTTTSSYKTAPEGGSEASSCKSGTDTDYFSPDEDGDDFFDISATDDESGTCHADFSINSLVAGDDITELTNVLIEVDELMDGSVDEQTEAYDLLRDKENQYSLNAEVLWRLAKAARNLSVIEENRGDLKKKESLIFEAFEYAKRALAVNERSAEVHKWYAILSGARGEYLGVRERIASGQVFKEHIDLALQISPNDCMLHHLLGRFCYEVSGLSWFEKKAATALFGGIPEASYEESFQHFMAAEELRPSGWKENRLFISKCLIEMQNTDEALLWLRKAEDIPVISADDEVTEREIQQLLQRYPS